MATGGRRLRITGIHHATLICASLDRSTPFYRDVLGLALVEQTVNEDDPSARHFFFGDATGSPGTVVSLIEYPRMEEGTVGRGSTHHVALTVESIEELEGWRAWLHSKGVEATEVLDRRFFHSIYLRDPDGHIIEIATRGPGFGPRVESSAQPA
ncbi:MAG: VOC family protein [Thermoleophilaceae bacterium]|nr:VOC family protein [Thermoleophilaceae bacterium]